METDSSTAQHKYLEQRAVALLAYGNKIWITYLPTPSECAAMWTISKPWRIGRRLRPAQSAASPPSMTSTPPATMPADDVLRLPVELLHLIIPALSYPQRVLAACVCKTWKDIAYTCPVAIRSPGNVEQVKALTVRLHRLTPAPLCISRTVINGSRDADFALALSCFLRDHMWRIRELELVIICTPFDDQKVCDALLAALSMPAPQLRLLHVYGLDQHQLRALATSWFGGYAPKLSLCSSDVRVLAAPAFRSVRTIRPLPSEVETRSELVHATLETLPHLENLDFTMVARAPPAELYVPSKIKHLWVDAIQTPIHSVDHARIPNIYVTGHDPTDAMEWLQSPPACRVDMHMSPPRNMRRVHTLHIRTHDADGRRRVFTYPPVTTFIVPDPFFAHVTVLSIRGEPTLNTQWLPSFPALRHFTLVCVAEEDGQHCKPALPLTLEVPTLIELILVAPAMEGPWILRADLVVAFILKIVGRATLDSVAVHGAELVAPGLDQLRECVVSVVVDVSAAPLEQWEDTVTCESV